MNIEDRELWNIVKDPFGKYVMFHENSFPLMIGVFCVSNRGTMDIFSAKNYQVYV